MRHLLYLSALLVLAGYRRRQQRGRLEGRYAAANITRPQVLSYSTGASDLLFINAYYARLKQALADPALRPATRRYLCMVRLYYGRPGPGHGR